MRSRPALPVHDSPAISPPTATSKLKASRLVAGWPLLFLFGESEMKRFLVSVAYPREFVSSDGNSAPFVAASAKRHGGRVIKPGAGHTVNQFVGNCFQSDIGFDEEVDARACVETFHWLFDHYSLAEVPEASRQAVLASVPKFAAWVSDDERRLCMVNGDVRFLDERHATS
jgi:hypothetical protein